MYNVALKSRCQSFLFPYQFYRFFTPTFLHTGITHLLSNFVYQALAETLLEGKYRVKTLGICYILFSLSANIMGALVNPKTSKYIMIADCSQNLCYTLVSLGASGAVYGLLLLCIIDNILRIFTVTNIHDKIIQFLITFLTVPYFIFSRFLDVDSSGHIDHAAHIGGAIMGILVALLLCDIPKFITNRIPNGEKRIHLIALISIVAYFIMTLLIFYLFIPIHLN